MRALIGVSSEMAGAVQQSVCHGLGRVCGVSHFMRADDTARPPARASGKARNGTSVPRVKLTAARVAFLHGVSDELIERA
ncbi:hypothetical protein [Caballeronia novacaledonica]|uniref:hypothetical protein n=1 Tax=Caballeronia novacaledonica TaxID=1544861 RepID=UPI0011B1FCAC|nr:hypothetical protein [Caballeronia novacaledonica]